MRGKTRKSSSPKKPKTSACCLLQKGEPYSDWGVRRGGGPKKKRLPCRDKPRGWRALAAKRDDRRRRKCSLENSRGKSSRTGEHSNLSHKSRSATRGNGFAFIEERATFRKEAPGSSSDCFRLTEGPLPNDASRNSALKEAAVRKARLGLRRGKRSRNAIRALPSAV